MPIEEDDEYTSAKPKNFLGIGMNFSDADIGFLKNFQTLLENRKYELLNNLF